MITHYPLPSPKQGLATVKKCFSKVAAICATSLALSAPAMACDPCTPAAYQDPSFFEMGADLLITRPLTLATTVVGGAVWLVSSPFSLLGGNAGQSANTLVAEPFRATFDRCLGCKIAPEHGG